MSHTRISATAAASGNLNSCIGGDLDQARNIDGQVISGIGLESDLIAKYQLHDGHGTDLLSRVRYLPYPSKTFWTGLSKKKASCLIGFCGIEPNPSIAVKVDSMSHPAGPPGNQPTPTIRMTEGWHCLHLYYAVNQEGLEMLEDEARAEARAELAEILDPKRPGAPARLQTSIVSGHKADFGLMMLDPDPLVLDSVQQAIRASLMGPALEPVYSFVSITEVSEYVPTVEQYGERLKAEGTDPASPAFAAKLKAYQDREVVMRKQRLYPDFPAWPVTCFYPMNKIRDPHANWYQEAFSKRMEMMTEHGRSGMMFAGRVTQLITASTGFDDYEWGVTLWARAPEFIKEIVYSMRFDEASAKYAEFGPFYISYVATPAELIKHLKM